MSYIPNLERRACDVANAIERLPGQLSALFKKGASAEDRLYSIGLACTKIRIGMEVVTNYIERNQPHLLDSHMQQIATILGNVERCAAREGSDEPRKTIGVLIVVAYRVANRLREWAEEQRASQGQPLRPQGSAPKGAPPAGRGDDGDDAADGLTPTDPGSDNDDKKPDDLMYLNVVCANYKISRTSLYRHIKDENKALKNWPELSGNKFRLSKAEVELLYESQTPRK